MADTEAVPQISRCRTLVPALLTVAVLSGCSGVPYAPGPTFEPSPPGPVSPDATPSSASSPTIGTGPAIELGGSVVADGGQVAVLDAHIELGVLGPAGRFPESRSARRLVVGGTASLTNPSDRINVAAASVDLVFQAGYLRTSAACEALPPPDGLTWGAYCWYLLGATSAAGADGSITALQPGEKRVRSVTTTAAGLGQLRTSDAEAQRTTASLHRPAVVVVITAPVDYNGTRLHGGCENRSTVVTPTGPISRPPEPAHPVRTANAVAAATSEIACRDLQYVGP